MSSELVAYYTHFAREHRLDIREECEVTDIRRDGDGYTIDTLGNVQERTLFSAKTILLCTGIYENNRTLSIKSDFDYCSHRFDLSTSGKNLLLLGGGNSAIDYIIHLLPKNKINWVLRSPKWSIVNDVLIQQFNDSMSRNAGNLKMYTNTEVVRLNADRSALLSDGTTLEGIDACTMLLGFNSRNPLFEKIGLEFDHECLKLGDGYETNLPNIYAFGAIMAQWDGKAPKPTFIHNGNMRQLNRIMDHIIAKETGKIFKAPAQPAQSASLPAEAKTRQGLMGLFRKSLRRVLSQ
ncbi:MAG: hypothetical protein EBZ50_04050 [Alphaproteobacteria bacterium]|nr:hypothetical protein [Alphaproteobacteria bacterium]